MAQSAADARIGAPITGQAHVDVISLRLAFGDRRVFDGLSCRFPESKISVILGASGVGKSTLLKLMAGLQQPDYGDIWIGQQEITRMPERQLRHLRRNLGMMFQGGALLDSLTVFDNVALALRDTDLSEAAIADKVHAQFEAVGLKRSTRCSRRDLRRNEEARSARAR
jgi:phospholipid/cholesterol/gamma-HCH transport system ATP-binding protein